VLYPFCEISSKGNEMTKRRLAALICIPALFAGCASYSSNVRVGHDVSYVSLADQRAASKSVHVYDSQPEGSRDLGLIEAGRCHRMFTETPPNQELVLLDLKVSAYARGGDGLTEVSIEQVSALTKNCWYMLVGRARALKVSN
jgi:hypothetical protein